MWDLIKDFVSLMVIILLTPVILILLFVLVLVLFISVLPLGIALLPILLIYLFTDEDLEDDSSDDGGEGLKLSDFR